MVILDKINGTVHVNPHVLSRDLYVCMRYAHLPVRVTSEFSDENSTKNLFCGERGGSVEGVSSPGVTGLKRPGPIWA